MGTRVEGMLTPSHHSENPLVLVGNKKAHSWLLRSTNARQTLE